MKFVFKSFAESAESLKEGMKESKQQMMDEGLWNDDITFEEWAHYAGSHCILTEPKNKETTDNAI